MLCVASSATQSVLSNACLTITISCVHNEIPGAHKKWCSRSLLLWPFVSCATADFRWRTEAKQKQDEKRVSYFAESIKDKVHQYATLVGRGKHLSARSPSSDQMLKSILSRFLSNLVKSNIDIFLRNVKGIAWNYLCRLIMSQSREYHTSLFLLVDTVHRLSCFSFYFLVFFRVYRRCCHAYSKEKSQSFDLVPVS